MSGSKSEAPKVEAPEAVPDEAEVKAPSIGRILHYVTTEGTIRPAIVAGVHEDGAVELVVFNKAKGAAFLGHVPIDNEFPRETPGTAYWPVY